MKKYSWYNNGINNKRVKVGEEPPEGFIEGFLLSEQGRKKLSSIKWYTNGIDDEIEIFSGDIIPHNYYEGRLPFTKRHLENLSHAHKNLVAWNKGLTKDTSKSVLKNSISISEFYKTHKVSNPHTKEHIQHIIDAKRKNNSFHTSKLEDEYLKKFIFQFGRDDVVYQYQDSRYINPETGNMFICDYYIKSLDLFIELHGYATHNDHPFNPSSDEDLKVLEKAKEKALLKPNGFDSQFIYVWTVRDPQKLQTFVDNNLNFCIIYPYKNIVISNFETPLIAGTSFTRQSAAKLLGREESSETIESIA